MQAWTVRARLQDVKLSNTEVLDVHVLLYRLWVHAGSLGSGASYYQQQFIQTFGAGDSYKVCKHISRGVLARGIRVFWLVSQGWKLVQLFSRRCDGIEVIPAY